MAPREKKKKEKENKVIRSQNKSNQNLPTEQMNNNKTTELEDKGDLTMAGDSKVWLE